MTNQELRELKAAVALPLQTDGINVRDADGLLVCVCNDIFADKKYAATIVALANHADELLDKADKYDAIMDKKVAVFCHPGEGD